MKKKFNSFKVISYFLVIALILISIASPVFAMKPIDEPQTVTIIGWIKTNNTNTYYNWELVAIDYSSKTITNEYSMSKTVVAKSATEAKQKVSAGMEAGVDYKIVNVGISGDGTWEINSSGELVTEWEISLKITEQYKQYYDRYNKVEYVYYIGELLDEFGSVLDYDYYYQLKSKTSTNEYEIRISDHTEAI